MDNERQEKISQGKFVNEILHSNEACFRYTGVPTVDLLKAIFNWIEPTAKHIKLWDGKLKLTPGRKSGRRRYKLSLFEEYLLTLVRIRKGFDTHHLAFLFAISQSHVCRMFNAWVNLLSKCLEQTLVWPTKETNKNNMPESFKAFPRTRVIIDCTELYVEKPFKPRAQRATWSTYKHANTFKLLVGIMPTGAITFVAKLYSGSTSDQNMVKLSNFVDKIEAGDDVMADRGFNILHLLPKRATLNIPAFSHGKPLSLKALTRSRKIAAVRIHVERAIRRMKTFKIITGIIPIRLRYTLNQILKVIAVLCNLQGRLA